MKKIILASAMSGVVLLLGACATTPKNTLAVQKENNQFEVTGIGKTNLIAKNNAITAAQKTCSKNTTPVVVDEKTTYNGVLKDVVSEKTGQMVEAAAGVIGDFLLERQKFNHEDCTIAYTKWRYFTRW